MAGPPPEEGGTLQLELFLLPASPIQVSLLLPQPFPPCVSLLCNHSAAAAAPTHTKMTAHSHKNSHMVCINQPPPPPLSLLATLTSH